MKPRRTDGKVMTAYYKYGWEAAENGSTINDCPYLIGSKEEREWKEGAWNYVYARIDAVAKEWELKNGRE